MVREHNRFRTRIDEYVLESDRHHRHRTLWREDRARVGHEAFQAFEKIAFPNGPASMRLAQDVECNALSRDRGCSDSPLSQVINDYSGVSVECRMKSKSRPSADQVLVILLAPVGMSVVHDEQDREGVDLYSGSVSGADPTNDRELFILDSVW